ncbi:MAG: hypothetical protein P8183_09915, partial [Anaerolineae bacterium]
MARLAVRQPVVAEIHVLKVARILVAVLARARVMVAWRIVAGRAVLVANIGMAKVSVVEVACILVA